MRRLKMTRTAVLFGALAIGGTAWARYLQPEPLLQNPKYVVMQAKYGRQIPVYSYALNNPLRFVDKNGLGIEPETLQECIDLVKTNSKNERDNAVESYEKFLKDLFGDPVCNPEDERRRFKEFLDAQKELHDGLDRLEKQTKQSIEDCFKKFPPPKPLPPKLKK